MPKDFILVGLTGGLGTGKSTVAGMLKEFGAEVIDADVLAHECLKKGSKPYQRVIAVFGKQVLDKCGRISRRRLAKKVFGFPRRLGRLTRIVHPPVKRALREKLRRSRAAVRVAVVPLLYEAGLGKWFDRVIVVSASPSTALARIGSYRRMTAGEFRQRQLAQLPIREKARTADFIIDNNGSRKRTRAQVRAVWQKLRGDLGPPGRILKRSQGR